MENEDCCDTGEKNLFPDIFEIIGKIGKRLEKFQKGKVSKLNISTAHYLILRHLQKNENVQVKDLLSVCQCEKSTLSGNLKTLEKDGYITRELKPNDKRSWIVSITEKGANLQTEETSIMELKIS